MDMPFVAGELAALTDMLRLSEQEDEAREAHSRLHSEPVYSLRHAKRGSSGGCFEKHPTLPRSLRVSRKAELRHGRLLYVCVPLHRLCVCVPPLTPAPACAHFTGANAGI